VLVREGLKMLLSTQPELEVVAEVGDGRAVEALVRESRAGLLILDLGLPGLHGVDVAAAVKLAFADAVKVLVLTGDLSPASVRKALAARRRRLCAQERRCRRAAGRRGGGAGRAPVREQAHCPGVPSRPGAGGGTGPAVATPREQEIIVAVARGLANREIAELLEISLATVRTHRQELHGEVFAAQRRRDHRLRRPAGLLQPGLSPCICSMGRPAERA